MNETNFSKLTACAISVLNTPYGSIRDKFPNNDIKFIDNAENLNAEKVAEIRFNAENATLSCTFDSDEKCDSSYLFFDEHTEIMGYIEYLKSKYFYDYLGCCWNIESCQLTIKRIDGIICFVVYEQ